MTYLPTDNLNQEMLAHLKRSTLSKGESRRNGEGLFVVDGIVDSKDNKEEKTREVANIWMYHFSWNFFHL